MAAFDYSSLNATAERLIERFGTTGTLKQVALSGTAYNPTQTTTSTAIKVVVTDYDTRDIDGTLIQRGDKKVLVSTEGLSAVPVSGDVLTLDSEDHNVVSVKAMKPGSTVLAYECQARK